ncbi:DUF305 domain-containing protein [Nocardia harenae]|uniref:DUF305 domain-containing protein n=1 Tax=Nocardia harenae TaxID=358707 RepID=UPI0008303AE4|nr:DUF305 domain-containing protein [Nocardia harenae]
MDRRSVVAGAALAALAALLVTLGAAVRPLLVPERAPEREILSTTEIAFLQDMTAHHEQALLMVQSLDPGVSPVIARLAAQIDDVQRVELGTMLGWLRLANALPSNPQPMAWLHEPSAGHHGAPVAATAEPTGTAMGMATRAELNALAAARGREAELLFLRLMQRHHYGGVAMARGADALLTAGPVKRAAREMVTEQTTEIGTIGLLLAQYG